MAVQLIKNLKFRNRLRQINNTEIKIGLFADSGETEDGIKLATLMANFEYGNAMNNLPARPVFRTTWKDNKKEINNQMINFYMFALMGKIKPKVASNMLGAYVEGELKAQFTKRKFAQLSPNYKKRPSGAQVTSSSIPLIDTGTMRSSISYRVGKKAWFFSK